uniref:Histone-lysine N-methyltransferase, H3 lysine-79 specific n=1 Tax=Angiostrongylus cantonensis TaxID=6313 RepID=A0A0K0DAT7_ANGCA
LDNGSATFNNVDKTNIDEVRAVIEDFNKVAAPYAKLVRCFLFGVLVHVSPLGIKTDFHSIRAPFNLYFLKVYGETSYEQMQSIIDQIGFREQDVFLDLGCGVGQLVMYVAGGTKVKKSVGIEINDLPARYGAAMGEDFSKWMKWWKKKCRPFQLIHGDMLDEQYRTLITQEATIIFINNYAFEPSLDLHIKNMLADCHMGTRIISTKAYATGTKRVNILFPDVESIMEVSQLKTVKQPTSWTPNTVPYYLHTVSHYKVRHSSVLSALDFVLGLVGTSWIEVREEHRFTVHRSAESNWDPAHVLIQIKSISFMPYWCHSSETVDVQFHFQRHQSIETSFTMKRLLENSWSKVMKEL